ncbi:hypothetical protein Glove_284g105 [Diversispora epigaea]|uniref:Uncharacterized protein n=1 Tax=Diversispora epigaea TaxID=1348612 RepID=A0A397I1H7_9GLOM|nr:hypothetical protein Glove_284g105 [Diversispora epigaea]
MEVDIVLENSKETGIQKLLYPFKKIRNVFTENIVDGSIHNTKLNKQDEFLQLSGDAKFFKAENILFKCYRNLLKIVFDENIRSLHITDAAKPEDEKIKICKETIFNYLKLEEQLLEEAIFKNSNSRLFKFVGKIDFTEDLSHRLIHIHTNIPDIEDNKNEKYIKNFYIEKFVQFASGYVVKKVPNLLIKNCKKELERFIMSNSLINEYSTLRNSLFEDIAH